MFDRMVSGGCGLCRGVGRVKKFSVRAEYCRLKESNVLIVLLRRDTSTAVGISLMRNEFLFCRS